MFRVYISLHLLCSCWCLCLGVFVWHVLERILYVLTSMYGLFVCVVVLCCVVRVSRYGVVLMLLFVTGFIFHDCVWGTCSDNPDIVYDKSTASKLDISVYYANWTRLWIWSWLILSLWRDHVDKKCFVHCWDPQSKGTPGICYLVPDTWDLLQCSTWL